MCDESPQRSFLIGVLYIFRIRCMRDITSSLKRFCFYLLIYTGIFLTRSYQVQTCPEVFTPQCLQFFFSDWDQQISNLRLTDRCIKYIFSVSFCHVTLFNRIITFWVFCLSSPNIAYNNWNRKEIFFYDPNNRFHKDYHKSFCYVYIQK